MHCSPSIRNWRESCFIVGIKEAKSSSSMSRYRDSLSLFFLFSSLFSLLYRPLSTTRGMRSERMLWPEMRFVPCNASLSLSLSRSITFLDRGWIDWRLFRRSYYWAGVPFARDTRVAIGMKQWLTRAMAFGIRGLFLNISIKYLSYVFSFREMSKNYVSLKFIWSDSL